MTNLTKTLETSAQQVDNLLSYLFSDKKAIYIDDITFNKQERTYEVSYCLEFTLQIKQPDWKDISIPRIDLLKYILHENLNQWESYRYDEITGNIMPATELATDIDIFLDDNYHEIIKKYLEEVKCG